METVSAFFFEEKEKHLKKGTQRHGRQQSRSWCLLSDATAC